MVTQNTMVFWREVSSLPANGKSRQVLVAYRLGAYPMECREAWWDGKNFVTPNEHRHIFTDVKFWAEMPALPILPPEPVTLDSLHALVTDLSERINSHINRTKEPVDA